MKKLLNFLGIVMTIIMVICEIAEFLAIPALLIVIGLLNSFSWQYYLFAILGYIVLFIVIEIASHFVFKVLDKKYTPIITRKLVKIFNRFSKKD